MVRADRRPVRGAVLSLAVFLLAAFAYQSAANVTGITVNGYFQSGKREDTAMILISSERVDGLNGEMTYDPNLFSNPIVTTSSGSVGYTALGNEVSPGVFRFVLYKNPANQPLALENAVLSFSLEAKADLVNSTMSTVNFTMAASARVVSNPDGSSSAVSVQPTTFQSFTIFVNGASAKDWQLYE